MLHLASLFSIFVLWDVESDNNGQQEGCVLRVQLIRIQMRVPEYGWTTQKVFHFLNFLVNGVRALVFVFRRSVQNLHPEVVLVDPERLAWHIKWKILLVVK
ncbi:hypothetical protein V6Z11_D01G139800 [Gossypium hirsutum]